MRTVAEIERALEEKKRELDELRGTETEVYARIVGYYRSVRNWNRGKREEYRHRVSFSGFQHAAAQPELAFGQRPDQERSAREQRPAPAEREGSAPAERPQPPEQDDVRADISSCTYFFRPACPNCKPVRSLISTLPISITDIDVDTADGMELAIEHGILATPTAIFRDSEGNVVCRSSDPREIADLLTT
jgi:ribonucleoside-triphosphate reductase